MPDETPPEKRAPRTVSVPMILMSVPQAIDISPDVNDWGQPVAILQVSWPMTTMCIELDPNAADQLIAQLVNAFTPQNAGLEVVQALPDHLKNGRDL